jgi:hypothetical protein
MAGPFAQITSGPATSTGKNTNIGSLIFDKISNIVESVGNAGLAMAHQTALFVVAAQAALTNITAAQNFFSQTLVASVLNKLNRTLLISGQFIYTSPGATTPTISLSVVLGGVTLCTITSAAISATASTNAPGYFQFELTTASTGSTGTIEAHGQLSLNIAAASPSAAIATYLDTNTAVSSAVNLGIANLLQVQIAASSTITSAQLRQFTVEVVS